MDELTRTVTEFAELEGACKVGIATVETLAGGPPSADITYVLPEAKSAVCFAFALDQALIPAFLAKKDRRSHERDNIRANTLASGTSIDLARYLDQMGHPSYALTANNVYRKDTKRGALDMIPDVSLRYLAVGAGIASFGLSGNVLTREHGAGIILGAVITSAELEPSAPLSPEENYCDGCGLCLTSCASSMMDPGEKETVTLGGREHTYSKRRSYLRCEFVCGGFTGLHPSGKWSTWSPGRFAIPESDRQFRAALAKGIEAYGQRPSLEGGFLHPLSKKKLNLTCGNCQLICVPDKEERKRRHRILTGSGCVVQAPDGSVEAVSPEEAARRVGWMPAETRAWYE
jgi:epoxyqueuosine reductase QueG